MRLFKKQDSTETWLVAGLGNPGVKYAGNRHNIGFMVVDAIADSEPRFTPFRSKFSGDIAEARLDNRKIVLLKPDTYMNNSGQSVRAAAKFFKIPPERIVVFHDELDLDPGIVRVKQGGGNAGHNGLKSTQAHLGTADFWRIRLGIGHPGDKGQVSNYVLSDFAKAEQSWLDNLLYEAAKHAPVIWREGPKEYGDKLGRQ